MGRTTQDIDREILEALDATNYALFGQLMAEKHILRLGPRPPAGEDGVLQNYLCRHGTPKNQWKRICEEFEARVLGISIPPAQQEESTEGSQTNLVGASAQALAGVLGGFVAFARLAGFLGASSSKTEEAPPGL